MPNESYRYGLSVKIKARHNMEYTQLMKEKDMIMSVTTTILQLKQQPEFTKQPDHCIYRHNLSVPVLP